jgi:hypothetical protein
MPNPQPFIVGRQSEVEQFAAFARSETACHVWNIYGPGGIGKTIVGQKIAAHAKKQNWPLAFIAGDRPDLTPDRILHAISAAFAQDEQLAAPLRDFDRAFDDYAAVQDLLRLGGGLPTLFDVVGNVQGALLAAALDRLGKPVTETVQRTVSNRFSLERYLRRAETDLTTALCNGLSAALEQTGNPLTIMMDTYEEMEGLDDWVCRAFAPALPPGIRLVVLGRNALPKVNFDWSEYDQTLHVMELPELAEADARSYLTHHGLRDSAALDEVIRFTGGYPLLLVLVVHLAREAGGWANVGALEAAADRDLVATQLLKRILREERVREVRDFLEKGVVARWFNPEIVSVVLGVSPGDGRAIYDKLRRHSFVERHPLGLKFHDKIRELLLERLKFNRPEHEQVTKRLMDYYAQKAGIKQPDEPATEPGAAKYQVHIQGASNIVIGDQASVKPPAGEPEKG